MEHLELGQAQSLRRSPPVMTANEQPEGLPGRDAAFQRDGQPLSRGADRIDVPIVDDGRIARIARLDRIDEPGLAQVGRDMELFVLPEAELGDGPAGDVGRSHLHDAAGVDVQPFGWSSQHQLDAGAGPETLKLQRLARQGSRQGRSVQLRATGRIDPIQHQRLRHDQGQLSLQPCHPLDLQLRQTPGGSFVQCRQRREPHGSPRAGQRLGQIEDHAGRAGFGLAGRPGNLAIRDACRHQPQPRIELDGQLPQRLTAHVKLQLRRTSTPRGENS